MTIAVGDRLPDITFKQLTESGMGDITTADIFAGKKVVVFAVPGAFTPTCSASHLPGFVEHAQAIRDKGVDDIVCTSVNDPFVMRAWGVQAGAEGVVTMLADGSALFAKAVGLDQDRTSGGMGVRSQRYAMIVEDGVVTTLAVEEPGAFDVSSAQSVLKSL